MWSSRGIPSFELRAFWLWRYFHYQRHGSVASLNIHRV